VERQLDRSYRAAIVDPEAFGRGSRAVQDQRAALKADRVRLVCRPCRKKIGTITNVDFAYGKRYSPTLGRMVEPAASKLWPCTQCTRNYRVDLERMRVEHAAAAVGRHMIELPLPKV
jgi:hypothetical protein